MMGSLGHGTGFGRLLKVRVHGFPAWFIRRTYYLLQMPGWGRRLRIMIDWTFALLFRPDIVKVGLDSETALLLREVALGDAAGGPQDEGSARTDSATDGRPLALVEPGVRRPEPAVIERGSTMRTNAVAHPRRTSPAWSAVFRAVGLECARDWTGTIIHTGLPGAPSHTQTPTSQVLHPEDRTMIDIRATDKVLAATIPERSRHHIL